MHPICTLLMSVFVRVMLLWWGVWRIGWGSDAGRLYLRTADRPLVNGAKCASAVVQVAFQMSIMERGLCPLLRQSTRAQQSSAPCGTPTRETCANTKGRGHNHMCGFSSCSQLLRRHLSSSMHRIAAMHIAAMQIADLVYHYRGPHFYGSLL